LHREVSSLSFPGGADTRSDLSSDGHLFTKAEDDVALFDKMEQDLMAA
jgi:hypothetical protein